MPFLVKNKQKKCKKGIFKFILGFKKSAKNIFFSFLRLFETSEIKILKKNLSI
jgi:hypothetical protein